MPSFVLYQWLADVCIVEKLAAAIDSDHTEDVSVEEIMFRVRVYLM